MSYLLILSGYEDQDSFWERLKLNIPSVSSSKLNVVYCEDILKDGDHKEKDKWLSEVLSTAKQFKMNVDNQIKRVESDSELKKALSLSECTLFSHNILNELSTRGMLTNIKGSVISFDSHFESVKNCIIVFDKKVKSIQNFKNFFKHFAKTLCDAEVVLLMEIGKTLNEAEKNRKAVNYVVSLFKSVGVITYPPEELPREILRYIALKKNSVLIFHKSNYKTIMEPKFKENLQNRKIAYYLDEF